MFRRIELINTFKIDGANETFKGGLMGLSSEAVANAWVDKLRGPARSLPGNTRFWFTEKGWAEVGRPVIRACQASGQAYRVLRIKENEVDVTWRDKHTGYEVAAQPRKRK